MVPVRLLLLNPNCYREGETECKAFFANGKRWKRDRIARPKDPDRQGILSCANLPLFTLADRHQHCSELHVRGDVFQYAFVNRD